MENSSTSTLSPAWPTRWPKDAFRPASVILVLALIAGALVIGVVLAAVAAQFLAPQFLLTRRLDGMSAILLSGVIELFIPVAVLVVLPRAARFSLRELGFAPPGARAIGIALAGVAAGVVLVNIASAAVGAVTHSGQHEQQVAVMFQSLHAPWQIATFAFFASIFVPVVEETVFRVFAFNVGLRYGGFWLGAIVSSILFGLAHGDLYNALPLALVGMVLCGVYYLTRNAFASMIAHGTFNLLTLVALLFFPKLAGG